MGYSTVRAVDFSGKAEASVLISPNPVVRDMNISFRRPQTGEFKVELVNALGQSMYARTYNLSGQTKLELHLNRNAQPGVYYLRIRNAKSNEQLMEKIILR